MRVARGTTSFNSPSFFEASVPSGAINTPVTLPPGFARLDTSPTDTGSMLLRKTMGIVVVAALAAWAATVPTGKITSTRLCTSSRAMAGTRSKLPSAYLRSIDRFLPST
jgi:hypothetical protein